MKRITVEATVENLSTVTEFVDGELEKNECSLKAQLQIDVAVDEIFSNIAYYAYKPNTGDAIIEFEINDTRQAKITFRDGGVAYNPLEKENPDVTLSAAEREIGGLGIYIVKQTMDAVEYAYEDGMNCLTIFKAI